MTLKAVAGNPALNAAGVVSVNNLGTSIANAAATLLPNWRLALQKVRENNSDCDIACVGDSTTQGHGGSTTGSITNTASWANRLAQLLNTSLTPCTPGVVVPIAVGSGDSDTRWTLGTGWTQSSGFGAAKECAYSAPTSASGNLVFSPGVNCDGFYVYYLGNSGLGTCLATGTGGTGVSLNGNKSAGTYKSALISCASASTSNTLTLAPPTVNTFYVVGVKPVLSTQKQVQIDNLGAGGSTSGTWYNSGNQALSGIGLIEGIAPALTIISLGINDAGGSVAASAFQTNMQALITAAKLSGDVILCTYPPSSGSPYTTFEPLYIPVYQSLAASNNCPLIDIYSRFSATWQTNLMNDTLHPNDYGYWDWAESVAAFLNSF